MKVEVVSFTMFLTPLEEGHTIHKLFTANPAAWHCEGTQTNLYTRCKALAKDKPDKNEQ